MEAEERKRARESERKGWQLRAYKYTGKDDSELAPQKGKLYLLRITPSGDSQVAAVACIKKVRLWHVEH